jgi:hypothetical protein
MLLFANKARSLLTSGITSAAGQTANITAASGALFVGVGGVATGTNKVIRCVLTAVDANGNDTGAYEIVEVTRAADVLTFVNRGLEGTTAAAWSAGTLVECRPSAGLRYRSPLILAQGIGQQAVATSNVLTSLLPGGTALSWPTNTFGVGDMLEVIANIRHTGTSQSPIPSLQMAQSGFDVFGGSSYSAAASPVIELNVKYTFRATAGSFKSTADSSAGVSNHNGGAFAFPNTDAFIIDILGKFSAAGATDSLSLDSYTVLYHKAT